jgi:hypothetical protein
MELEDYVRSLSEIEDAYSIVAAKEFLLEQSGLVIKDHANLSYLGSLDVQKHVQFARDQIQAIVHLESQGTGSPFEIPIFQEGQVAAEDGLKFLKQYARGPQGTNLYDLVFSEYE